jgi:hypothetical protein
MCVVLYSLAKLVTNFCFLFKQVKHPEVAQFLGGRLYDCVFKYNEVVS